MIASRSSGHRAGTAVDARRVASVFLQVLVVMLLLLGCGKEANPSPKVPAPAVVAAAGDIATCGGEGDEATAELLAGIKGTVITLGDNAYERGTESEFRECYAPTWGRYKDRTRPVPGNHEYYMPGAEGYFDYFGERAAGEQGKGYYSYDLGRWHIVALNSSCEQAGGCSPGSPQVRWLEADLAKNSGKACTLAYMHFPLFTSGKHRPGVPAVKPLWEALYAGRADVVLSGHDHNYQRFAPQNPGGWADPDQGIREFVVGTGGKSYYEIESPIKNSEVYNDDTHGVLKLTLRSDSYDWKFIPVLGKTFTDSGSGRCH